MTFVKSQLSNSALKVFLDSHCLAIGHKQNNGSLVSVYKNKQVIKVIERKIDTLGKDGRYQRYLPAWERHLKEIKGLK